MNHEDEYVKMICIVYLVSIIYVGGKCIRTTYYDHLLSFSAEKRKSDQRIVHGNVGRPWCLVLTSGDDAGRSAQRV